MRKLKHSSRELLPSEEGIPSLIENGSSTLILKLRKNLNADANLILRHHGRILKLGNKSKTKTLKKMLSLALRSWANSSTKQEKNWVLQEVSISDGGPYSDS
ncbi:MAG: hypothetical protein KDD45_16565 [Bdellovibrionales bacterium]|nr:hypothetical protein [Bdellovibrionales bacterium]